jgi:hypothetical protein
MYPEQDLAGSHGNYASLARTLRGAYDQASKGKGKERHADDEPFQHQKICVINRWLAGSPVAGALFQAVKKTVESARLSDSAAIHELRGAINYLAAAIILLEERMPEEKAEKEPEYQTEDIEEKVLDTFAERRAETTRYCSECKFWLISTDDMPCKKCWHHPFRPHWRYRK